MYTLCWSPKGGCGTTVVAATLALLSARREPTIVVDLGGDLPAVLGAPTPPGPGLAEWLASPHADGEALVRISTEVAPRLRLVHMGDGTRPLELAAVHAERLAAAAADTATHVVIDAARGSKHLTLHHCATASLVVLRNCYLAARSASLHHPVAHGAVVVAEPGRALPPAEVARIAGVPLAAKLTWDVAVARCVDAGLLASRLPVSLARQLAPLSTPRRALEHGPAALRTVP